MLSTTDQLNTPYHILCSNPLIPSPILKAQYFMDPIDELKAIIAGLIGGGKYGIKIRAPHAIVMTLLFRRESSAAEKLGIICRSSFEHSKNLASFAAFYKTILCLLKWISIRLRSCPQLRKNTLFNIGHSVASLIVNGPTNSGLRLQSPPGLPERTQHAVIAGSLGGYIIWGKYSSINYQIVLYLTSRILVALLTLAREKKISPFHWKLNTGSGSSGGKGINPKNQYGLENAYPIGAAVVWGTVMALFEAYPDVLHPSLKRSMDEVYRYANSTRDGVNDDAGKNSVLLRKAS